MQIPQAAFCALEAYRWVFRSALRLQGYRFVKLMQQPADHADAAAARRAGHGGAAADGAGLGPLRRSRRTSGG